MKAGVIVESLGMSQSAMQITRSINKAVSLEEYWDIVVFYTQYDKILLSPHFAMMDVAEIYGFDGPIISTNVETTKIALGCKSATKKFFYVWDLEWTHRVFDVDEINKIYMNPEIELIARSEEHSSIIENCWKKPIAVIENFNHEKLTELISK